ncbi:hypothetical protein HDU76_009580, partial [Blyttiomyces sp. JEL0837]
SKLCHTHFGFRASGELNNVRWSGAGAFETAYSELFELGRRIGLKVTFGELPFF